MDRDFMASAGRNSVHHKSHESQSSCSKHHLLRFGTETVGPGQGKQISQMKLFSCVNISSSSTSVRPLRSSNVFSRSTSENHLDYVSV